MSGKFRVGVVLTTHGVKGAVKVLPTTDDIRRFSRLERVLFSPDDIPEHILREYEIEKVMYLRQFVLLKFRGLSDMDQAALLAGGSLWITDEQAEPLKENQYYIRDLIGLRVRSDEGELLGSVDDVLKTGANAVLSVLLPDGSQLLLPMISECILAVDRDSGTITVHVLEGLL